MLSNQYFSIFLLQDVMRSDPAKEYPSRLKLKSEEVVHGHGTLSGETMGSCHENLFHLTMSTAKDYVRICRLQ
jgi:hypothetical protein